jgi:hypothetical protein
MFAPCRSPTEVVDKIALKKAMQTKQDLVAFVIRSDSSYSALYATLFRAPIYDDDQTVLLNVELALDAYMQRLVSTDSRFDGFIAGDDTALDAQETRGFALFVGRGMCIECHTGWRFTDDKPRVTGVTDEVIDDGRDGSGAFHTPGLRNIAKTAPYMHNGLTGSLSDVIWFYRQGGGTTTFPKDPLMKKADLSDPEAADLEAFLVALTGTEIPYALRTDTHSQEPVACRHKNGKVDTLCGSACVDLVTDHDNCGKCGLKCGDQQVCMGQCYGPMACGPSLTMCATGCTNTQTDAAHCGSCGHACATGETCVAGTCTAAACPVGQQQCNGACIDVATDPANCGTCGNVCPPTTSCQAGSCQPLMCFPPTMACSNACVNVTSDTQNCGACGNICPPNKPSCVMGTCKP